MCTVYLPKFHFGLKILMNQYGWRLWKHGKCDNSASYHEELQLTLQSAPGKMETKAFRWEREKERGRRERRREGDGEKRG